MQKEEWGKMLHLNRALKSPYKLPYLWIHSAHNLFIYYLFWSNMFTESGRIVWVNTLFQKIPSKSPIFLDLTINNHPPLPMRKAEENNSEMSAAKEVSILKDSSLGD